MLEKAQEEMPSSVQERERFEIPKIKGHMEGNKTILVNLRKIAETLRRPPAHLFKYLLKELATPGLLRGGNAVFGTKLPASKINDKIHKYATELVLCRECGKADTKFVEDEAVYVSCQACGAKYQVKTHL